MPSGAGGQLTFAASIATEDFDFVVGQIQPVQGDLVASIVGMAPFEPSNGDMFGFITTPVGPGLSLVVNFNGSTLYGTIPAAPYVFGDDAMPVTVLFRFDSENDYWTFATYADIAYSDLSASPARILFSTLDKGVRSQVIGPKNLVGRRSEASDVSGLERSEVLEIVGTSMGVLAPITTAGSPYSASEGECVRFDATDPAGGTISLPVPAVDSRNAAVSAKEVGGGSGTWVFDGNGKLIDGQATRQIGSAAGAYRAMEVRWDFQSDQWRVFWSYSGDLA